MYFLQEHYRSQLFSILLRYSPLASKDGRRSTLINSGLPTLTTNGAVEEGHESFVNWLIAQFTQDVSNGKSDDLLCVKFFAQMIAFPIDLQEEDKRILVEIIEICKREHEACRSMNNQLMLSDFIPSVSKPKRSRNRTSLHAKRHVNQNFRETIIIKYDLEDVIKEFRSTINFGKACAFIIEQEHNLLRDYVFERARREFEAKMGRNPIPININLYKWDYPIPPDLETIIEEKVKSTYGCKTLGELFVIKHPYDHILCTVWNDYLPASDICFAMNAFWQKVKEITLPHLQTKGLCFALLLAHLPNDSIVHIDEFSTLQLPGHFAIKDDLLPWVKGHLSSLNVEADQVELYERLLNNPHAQFLETFRQLEHIVKEVQENYNQGRYKRRRSQV